MRRRRRRRDLAIGLALAILAGAVAVVLWMTSDAKATSVVTPPAAEVPAIPSPAAAVPRSLHQIWTLPTDPARGAVVSPYGAVVTTDVHTVSGHRLDTGATLWSYARSNTPLCAVGTSATAAAGAVSDAGNGIVTVYATNGWCSQVRMVDPTTGALLRSRTSPNLDPGTLVFGGPYAGWVGSDLLEVWRYDFVRGIQYGDQPNPVNSDGPHTGCTFGDFAMADQQFAVVEHCDAQPGTAHLVVSYADLDPSDNPAAKSHQWDPMHSKPRATIDTRSPVAVIVGITPDREAILVTSPAPALVVYDNAGTEISRTPVDIPASEIAATAGAGITPSVTISARRYSLVGGHLLAVSTRSAQAPASTTGVSSHPTTPTGTPPTVTVDSPHLDWIAAGVLGLPTRVADTILAPVGGGLVELRVSDGSAGRTIPLDRGSYRGRVDVSAVGSVIVEVRSGTVVGYAPAS